MSQSYDVTRPLAQSAGCEGSAKVTSREQDRARDGEGRRERQRQAGRDGAPAASVTQRPGGEGSAKVTSREQDRARDGEGRRERQRQAGQDGPPERSSLSRCPHTPADEFMSRGG